MPKRFVVEAGERPVGVAVRGSRGFEFSSANADFASLDGRTFARARSLVLAVAKHAQRTRRHATSPLQSPAGLW